MSGSKGSSYGRGAAILSVGIGATGLITFAYFSLASHALPEDEYGRITLLWSAVFITVSVLYRPVEQLLSRTIADHDARGVQGTEHLRVAGTIQLGLGLLFVVVALALRGPIEDDLFAGSSALYWILVVAVLAYAASYFARGYLAGHRLFPLYGGLVLMEATSRCLFALAVAVGIAEGQTAVALGMAAAPIVSLAVVPPALARRLDRQRSEAADPADAGSGQLDAAARDEPAAREPEFTLARGHRLRRRRPRRDALRADLPERRPAARQGDRGRGRRGARRLRLQRAPDRARTAAALPGGADLDPPPPHPRPGRRRARRVLAQRERDARRRSRGSRASSRW